MPEHRVHRYTTRCMWKGSTGAGYDKYQRTHTASAQPAQPTLTLSSDAAFRGNPEMLNPEQLLVIAASSCQLLSFLAVAARARVDVLEYEDNAEAVMPEDDAPVRITSIQLRPRIVVAAGSEEERVRHLVEVAHEQCYIANSLKTSVTVHPQIEFRKLAAAS
jgi:organic hydroperoxide reductase OsmC/OhrA